MSKLILFPVFFVITLSFLTSCSSYQVWIPDEIKKNKSAVKLYLKTYRSYAHHKAIAINSSGYIYATAGFPTQQLAKLNALKGCEDKFKRLFKKHRKNLTQKWSKEKLKNVVKCRVIDVDGVYIKQAFLSKASHAGEKLYLDEQGIPHIIGFHQIDLYSLKYDYLNDKQVKQDHNTFSHYYNPIRKEIAITKSNIIYYGVAKSVDSSLENQSIVYAQTFDKSFKKVSSIYFTPANHNNISASSIEFLPPSSLMVASDEATGEEESLLLSKYDLSGQQIFQKSLNFLHSDIMAQTLDQKGNAYLVYQTSEDELKYYLLALDIAGKEKYRNEIKLSKKSEDIDVTILQVKSYQNELYLFYTEDDGLYLNHYNGQGQLVKNTKIVAMDVTSEVVIKSPNLDKGIISILTASDKIKLYQYNTRKKKVSKSQQLNAEANSFNDAVINSDGTVFLLGWFDVNWKPTPDDENHPIQKTLLIFDKSGKMLNPLNFKN